MAELTINTEDITAALRKNLEGFTPDFAYQVPDEEALPYIFERAEA